MVDDHFHVKGIEDIYSIGDCSQIENNRLPQTAQIAKQQAYYLAKNLNSGQPEVTWKEFKFNNMGVMAYIGGDRAVMDMHEEGWWRVARKIIPNPVMERLGGFIAFLGWRSVYWGMQLSMRNRYLLLTDWMKSALFGRDLTRHNKPSRPK